MTVVQEDHQELRFDSAWTVIKWDEAPEFVGSFDRALHSLPGEGVKASDVVAVRAPRGKTRTLLIAEFKDFDRPAISATEAERAVSDELARRIVRKVIDTLCGVTFAHDARDARSPKLDSWRPSLARSTSSLLVLVCIEVPKSQAVAAGPWTKKLQQRLRWLGPNAQIVVTNSTRPFAADGIAYGVK